MLDREEALKDDFRFEASSYSYEDDEDWNEDDAKWTEDEQPEEEVTDAKDENNAYLEFLNEEVSNIHRSRQSLYALTMSVGRQVQQPAGRVRR